MRPSSKVRASCFEQLTSSSSKFASSSSSALWVSARSSSCRRCYSNYALSERTRSEWPPIYHQKSLLGPQKSLEPTAVIRNEVGVQMLSPRLRRQLFKDTSFRRVSSERIRIARQHLKAHGLLDKVSSGTKAIDFTLPPMLGSLEEHIWRMSLAQAEPYLSLAKLHASVELPPRPDQWALKSGWVRYNGDKTWERVDSPTEPILTFDVETMYKESKFGVMATAASENAWYGWISPWLLGESDRTNHLIPMGSPDKSRIIVGHNVAYDRARIAEEYSLQGTANRFLDTMSLHVATSGITSGQRPLWHLHRNKERPQPTEQPSGEIAAKSISTDWRDFSSINNLRDVAKLHLDIEIEKETRNWFGEFNREQVLDHIQELMNYCATDVWVTHLVYCNLLDKFLQLCPHPASFAGQLIMGSSFLPVNEEWEDYISKSEETFRELSDAVTAKLEELARETAALFGRPEVYNEDPWLRQLDWSKQGTRPRWFTKIHQLRADKVSISTRSQLAPLLLKVTWRGYPLYYSRGHGWLYGVPRHRFMQQIRDNEETIEASLSPVVFTDSADQRLESLTTEEGAGCEGPLVFFKLPHKDGMEANVGSPFSKPYIPSFEDGTLQSTFPEARRAIEMNSACSYWISARERIRDQFVVWESEGADMSSMQQGFWRKAGMILPQVITMGTVTRRAVENTWLTASNAKVNRVGSELKAMVKAPPGYKIVGADVDSEELWISSVMGDAQLGMHGGTALGWMTLEGSKTQGTDLHSKTANILGISRDNAKIFNYARIYGAGQKYAAQLLSKFNPDISAVEARTKAKELYNRTKGRKFTEMNAFSRRFWHGGTESFVFNTLEHIALSDDPRTPALGCGITQALTKKNLGEDSSLFMTSRVNWVVQSSGVDYLHLLIMGMQYLSAEYHIDARFMLSVHDEVRFLVKEDDALRAALALQISNLWTRAFFSCRLGLADLPQSAAFFSAVDVDHVLRKEPDSTCITPSNQKAISPGISLVMEDILRLTKGELQDKKDGSTNLTREDYSKSLPDEIPKTLLSDSKSLLWLQAQAATEASQIRSLASLNSTTGPKKEYRFSRKEPTSERIWAAH